MKTKTALIKINLTFNGVSVATLEALKEHASVELLDYCLDGRLARFLETRGHLQEAAAVTQIQHGIEENLLPYLLFGIDAYRKSLSQQVSPMEAICQSLGISSEVTQRLVEHEEERLLSILTEREQQEFTLEAIAAEVKAFGNVNAMDKQGQTPLMRTIRWAPNTEIIRALIQLGADVNAKDHEGRPSLWFACSIGNEEIVRVLIDAGAKSSELPSDISALLNETACKLLPQSIVLSGITLNRIDPGNFLMGSPVNEVGRGNAEVQHQVTITRPYWIGVTQVTQAQWQTLMGNNPSEMKIEDRPVEKVSWDDAAAFCKKLTDQAQVTGTLPAGYEYRLPTEAEWEYACRAGSTGPFAGTGVLTDMGWFGDNSLRPKLWWNGDTYVSSRDLPAINPVGSKKPNAWGLYDMHGNMDEWCQDWYGDYPVDAVTDPSGPATGEYRVLRGGNYESAASYCRSAHRSYTYPHLDNSTRGFRVVLAPVIR